MSIKINLERKKQMMAMLEQSRSLTVKELAAALYVSETTVRRDLTELEREGLLKRSFGGAVLNERFPDQLPLSLRAAERIQEKDKSKLGKEYPFRVADVRDLDGIVDEEEKRIPSEAL